VQQGPEIQQMYSLNMPVAKIRAKVREEFEKHRYVNNLQAVDVLIMQSNMEFQVRGFVSKGDSQSTADTSLQETLNYWKQLSHVMKYFRKEEDPNATLPKNFISGFLEVSVDIQDHGLTLTDI
jgi:NADH dehydrogenase (ubiquinone) 1 alpha subcomplex subunit 6